MESYTKEIKKVFPNAKITQNENYFKIEVPGYSTCFEYVPDLHRFKRYLQKINLRNKKKICRICLEIYRYSFICNICHNNVCISCFNKIRFENYGKMVCPYCRDTRGHKIWNRFETKITLCKDNIRLLQCFNENISIIPPAAIYIRYDYNNKNFVFDSGGIFEEIDGKMSDKCKYELIDWYSFYYDILAYLFDHPVFEMVT